MIHKKVYIHLKEKIFKLDKQQKRTEKFISWIKKSGLAKGLELDAFTPDRIRDIFVSSLKN